jgi:hypothetical protein
MNKRPQPYRILNKISAMAMIFALLWLTVSAPFVNAAAQQLDQIEHSDTCQSPVSGEEEATPPLGNTTEEKAGSTSLSEEYLHGHDKNEHIFSSASLQHISEHADTYNAFHGELLVPPPNFS